MATLVLDEPKRQPTLVLDEPLGPSFQETPEQAEKKAADNLSLAQENNIPVDIIDSGLFDVMGRLAADPLEMGIQSTPETTKKAIEDIERRRVVIQKITNNPISRVMWKGLGIIGWPFERIENLIAGPLTPISKESARRAKLTFDYVMDIANGVEPSDEAKEAVEIQHFFDYIRNHSIPAFKESGKALVPAVKALNPWAKIPQKDLASFTDWYRGYWMGWMNDEPPPEWLAQTEGVAAGFVVTPTLVGKVFKFAGKLGKATPVYKAIQEYRIPEYQAAKQITRLETRAKVYDAEQLGKTISQNDLKDIAQQISEKAGTPISPAAVQQRLVQIIKGGITEQPALSGKASPIIDEFKANAEILREYGILSDYTYTTKLTNAQKARINNNIGKAEKMLERLKTEAPYQSTLLQKISGLTPDIARQQRITEKLIDVAVKAEQRGDTLAATSEKFIDVALEVTTGSPLSKKVSTLLDFAPGDKRLTTLGNKILSMEKFERTARNKEANLILKEAAKINPRVEKYVNQTISDILKVADTIEDTKIIGLKPLQKYVKGMKYRFPGKAGQIEKLEESIQGNLDRLYTNEIYGGTNYYPRLYLTKEAEAAGKRFPFWSKGRIRAPYAKAREKIPVEVRKEMGEIFSDYPVAKRLIQQGIDIELAKHYRQIAQTPGWTSRVEVAGYRALPNEKAYGELAGKYVKNVIYHDLKDLHYVKGNVAAIYDAWQGAWKLSVTAFNPPTHFRNMFSNSILLDLSGVDHIEQAKLIKQMIGEISKNSDEYQQAKRYLTKGTFTQSEILDDLLAGVKATKGQQGGLANSINFVTAQTKRLSKIPSDIYGKEEFAAKFVKYLSERNKGKSVIEAVQESNKWLFDYSDLSSFEKNYIRRFVFPFMTFPRKAIPRVLESMAQNPHTIAKYPLMMWAVEKQSLHSLKLTDADLSNMKKIMPDYMKNGSYMLMPYRDDNGDLRFFDITYLLPWGQISDLQDRGISNVVLSNPMLQAIGDIQRNKDGFTGQKIWEDTDTAEEKFIKQVLHVWQCAAPVPSWFPGGYNYDRIYQSITGKPSKKWDILLDKKPLLPETLLQTMGGIRLAPYDYEKQSMFYYREKQEHLIELEKKLGDSLIQHAAGNLSDDELAIIRSQYLQQMADLLYDEE